MRCAARSAPPIILTGPRKRHRSAAESNSFSVRLREAGEKIMEAARRREIDVVLVWRLDRWARSVTDLLAKLQELEHLGVGFVSLTEALDLTTPAGRAMAGLLAIFSEFEREVLRERTRAGLAHAREKGKRLANAQTDGGSFACRREPQTDLWPSRSSSLLGGTIDITNYGQGELCRLAGSAKP
jgi:DNA invertase Pin-like site-specific DNA recombinase